MRLPDLPVTGLGTKADARIAGPDTIEVAAAGVKEPTYIRFGWNTLARFNLINKEGLPAVSCRVQPKSASRDAAHLQSGQARRSAGR